jgi:hypothetical protein
MPPRLGLSRREGRPGPVAHRRGAVVIIRGRRAVQRRCRQPALGSPIERNAALRTGYCRKRLAIFSTA